MSEPATQSAPDIHRTHSPSDAPAHNGADHEASGNTADNNTAIAASLDARYGTSRRNGLDRRFAWSTGIALVVAGLAFLFFSGWQQGSEIEFQDIGHEVVSDQQVKVSFEVTAPAHAEVACAIEALSASKGTVGWRIITLPVTESRSHTVRTSVTTTTTAVTGSVRSCWLLSE